MTTKTKTGSTTWSHILLPWAKTGSSTWSPGVALYTKTGSTTWTKTWERIPDNVVICYTDTGDAAQGSSTFLTEDDVLLKGKNGGSNNLTGATTHTIDGHGLYTSSPYSYAYGKLNALSYYKNCEQRAVGTGSEAAETSSTHHHGSTYAFRYQWTTSTSGHSIMRRRSRFGARRGGYYLPKNAIVFSAGQNDSWWGWTRYTAAEGRYLALYSTLTSFSYANDPTDSHPYDEDASNTFNHNDTYDCTAFNGFSYYQGHYHTYRCTPAQANHGIQYRYLQVYQLDYDMPWGALPSNTVVFLYNGSGSIPTGWTSFTSCYDRVPYLTSSSTSTGGSWGHNHSWGQTWRSDNTSGALWSLRANSPESRYIFRHTDRHTAGSVYRNSSATLTPTSYTGEPRNVELHPIIKT
jgi:hypothetical protein